MYRVRITDPAAEDISSIINYINSILNNPAAAADHLAEIEKAINSLKEMPGRYPKAEDKYLDSRKIRYRTVKNYCIFYTISDREKMVTVIRVLYARSSWKDLLED